MYTGLVHDIYSGHEYAAELESALNLGSGTTCCVNSNGQILYIGTVNGDVLILDMLTKFPMGRLPCIGQPISSISVTFDQIWLVSTTTSGLVTRYHLPTLDVEKQIQYPYPVKSAQLSPNNHDICIVTMKYPVITTVINFALEVPTYNHPPTDGMQAPVTPYDMVRWHNSMPSRCNLTLIPYLLDPAPVIRQRKTYRQKLYIAPENSNQILASPLPVQEGDDESTTDEDEIQDENPKPYDPTDYLPRLDDILGKHLHENDKIVKFPLFTAERNLHQSLLHKKPPIQYPTSKQIEEDPTVRYADHHCNLYPGLEEYEANNNNNQVVSKIQYNLPKIVPMHKNKPTKIKEWNGFTNLMLRDLEYVTWAQFSSLGDKMAFGTDKGRVWVADVSYAQQFDIIGDINFMDYVDTRGEHSFLPHVLLDMAYIENLKKDKNRQANLPAMRLMKYKVMFRNGLILRNFVAMQTPQMLPAKTYLGAVEHIAFSHPSFYRPKYDPLRIDNDAPEYLTDNNNTVHPDDIKRIEREETLGERGNVETGYELANLDRMSISVCYDGGIVLYDVKMGDVLTSFTHPDNTTDEIITPHSTCFNPRGTHIYAGFKLRDKHHIYIFPTQRKFNDDLTAPVRVLRGPSNEGNAGFWAHPLLPSLITLTFSGRVLYWTSRSKESWTAFNPLFQELEDNLEYNEQESSFDYSIVPTHEGNAHKGYSLDYMNNNIEYNAQAYSLYNYLQKVVFRAVQVIVPEDQTTTTAMENSINTIKPSLDGPPIVTPPSLAEYQQSDLCPPLKYPEFYNPLTATRYTSRTRFIAQLRMVHDPPHVIRPKIPPKIRTDYFLKTLVATSNQHKILEDLGLVRSHRQAYIPKETAWAQAQVCGPSFGVDAPESRPLTHYTATVDGVDVPVGKRTYEHDQQALLRAQEEAAALQQAQSGNKRGKKKVEDKGPDWTDINIQHLLFQADIDAHDLEMRKVLRAQLVKQLARGIPAMDCIFRGKDGFVVPKYLTVHILRHIMTDKEQEEHLVMKTDSGLPVFIPDPLLLDTLKGLAESAKENNYDHITATNNIGMGMGAAVMREFGMNLLNRIDGHTTLGKGAGVDQRSDPIYTLEHIAVKKILAETYPTVHGVNIQRDATTAVLKALAEDTLATNELLHEQESKKKKR